jgi:hypothetical protein
VVPEPRLPDRVALEERAVRAPDQRDAGVVGALARVHREHELRDRDFDLAEAAVERFVYCSSISGCSRSSRRIVRTLSCRIRVRRVQCTAVVADLPDRFARGEAVLEHREEVLERLLEDRRVPRRARSLEKSSSRQASAMSSSPATSQRAPRIGFSIASSDVLTAPSPRRIRV